MINSSPTGAGLPIVLWQPIFSPHQTPLLEQLANDWNGPIFLVVDKESDFKREKSSGWKTKIPQGINISTNGNGIPSEAIHIVSGFYGTRLWRENRRDVLQNRDSKVWVMAESLATWDDPVKSVFRFIRHGISRILIRKRFSGFLAIGEAAASQARLFAVPRNKIFPFCYVTLPPENPQNHIERGDQKPTVLFVGRISKRKGTDVLIKATPENTQLQIIGNHSEKDIILPPEVDYVGIVLNSEVSNFIQKATVLILPSRYDGWGAVINEALMVGTPVICTSACGGSSLLNSSPPYRGEVVTKLTADNLNFAIRKVLNSKIDNEAIRNWSLMKIGPIPVSRYLVEILSGKNVPAPWTL